jgi:putative hemolysin
MGCRWNGSGCTRLWLTGQLPVTMVTQIAYSGSDARCRCTMPCAGGEPLVAQRSHAWPALYFNEDRPVEEKTITTATQSHTRRSSSWTAASAAAGPGKLTDVQPASVNVASARPRSRKRMMLCHKEDSRIGTSPSAALYCGQPGLTPAHPAQATGLQRHLCPVLGQPLVLRLPAMHFSVNG